MKKIKCYVYKPWSHISNSLNKYGPNELQCLSLMRLYKLMYCNTILWGSFLSYEENEVLRIQSLVSYQQHFILFLTSEWALWAWVLVLDKALQTSIMKHASLQGPFADKLTILLSCIVALHVSVTILWIIVKIEWRNHRDRTRASTLCFF